MIIWDLKTKFNILFKKLFTINVDSFLICRLPGKEELHGGKITLEKEMYIDVKNYIREKKGLYYAVVVYRNVKGERKEK